MKVQLLFHLILHFNVDFICDLIISKKKKSINIPFICGISNKSLDIIVELAWPP